MAAAAAVASPPATSPAADEPQASSAERAARAERLCARPVPNCPLVLDDDDDGVDNQAARRHYHDNTIHLAASAGREAPAPSAATATATDPTATTTFRPPSRPLSPPPAPRLHGDPDYELPQGRLTETRALRRRAAADAAARPPPQQQQQQQQDAPLPRVDRYGFFVPEGEDAMAAAGPSSPNELEQHRRAVEQWRRMLRGEERGGGGGTAAAPSSADATADALEAWFARHPRRTKKLMRAGVPDEFRGLAWHALSGGRALARLSSEAAAAAASPSSPPASNSWAPLLYTKYLDNAASDGDERADTEILRDLGRTFPGHALLQQRQGPGQRSLFQVLRAYRALDPEVGYVQGMAFVVGVLLMYLPEEAAFWTFAGLMLGGVEGAKEVLVGTAAGASATRTTTTTTPKPALRRLPLRGMFLPGMPELKRCMRRFECLLARRHPPLGKQLAAEGVDPSLYCAPWFPTMYAYSLPFPHVLRVWDVLLAEGLSPKPLHRVGLALVGSEAKGLSALPFEALVPALNGTGPPVSEDDDDDALGAADQQQQGSSWWRASSLSRRRKRRAAAGAAAAATAASATAPSGGGSSSGRRRPRFPILGRPPDALIRAACRIKVSRALRRIEAAEEAEAEAEAARRRT